MSKVIGSIIIGILVIGGIWWWIENPSGAKDDAMMGPEASVKKDSMMPAGGTKEVSVEEQSETGMKDESTVKEGGSGDTAREQKKYVEYTQQSFDGNNDEKRVLFFYASWCPFCKSADADYQKMTDKIPDGVVVVRVNYKDSDTDAQEKALADTYGVTTQHTFVQIDSDGNEVTKWVGGSTEALIKNIQ